MTSLTKYAAALAWIGIAIVVLLIVPRLAGDESNTDVPVISVTAWLSGAGAETMAATVAAPLERQFAKMPGVTSITSTSRLGETSVTIRFDNSRSVDDTARNVQAAIGNAQMPAPMTSPPVLIKGALNEEPIIYLAMTSETPPLNAVEEFAEHCASRINMESGVGRTSIYGGLKRAVHIQLEPDALAADGLTIDQVESAAKNVQGSHALDFMKAVIAYRNGVPVRFLDVAVVKDSFDDERAAAWYGDRRAVILAVQRQPGSNAAEVMDRIRKRVSSFRFENPAVSILVIDNTQVDRTASAAVEFPEGTSFDEMMKLQRGTAGILSRNPAVESMISILDRDAGRIILRTKAEADGIVQEMRRNVAVIPGVKLRVRLAGTRPSRYILTSELSSVLVLPAREVEEKLRALPGIQNVFSDLAPARAETTLRIDRDKLLASGVSAAQIESAFAVMRGDRRISVDPTVIMELRPTGRAGPDQLSKLYVRDQAGRLLTLSMFAAIETRVSSSVVNHTNLFPSVTISFDIQPGVDVKKALSGLHLPAHVHDSLELNGRSGN